MRAPPDGYTLLLVGPPALGPVGDQTLLGRRRGRLGRHPVMRRLPAARRARGQTNEPPGNIWRFPNHPICYFPAMEKGQES